MDGICYIVGAGDFYGDIKISCGDMLIAADGGYETVFRLGLIPDVLIGDFDSIENLPENIITLRYPAEKDETDMLLAYKIGKEKGYKKFLLYGGVGGRDDHTFANYSLLLYAKNEENTAVLIGNHIKSYIIKNEKTAIFGKGGKTFSVFAFGGRAAGVNIKGAKYEAIDAILECDFPLGVSNSLTDSGEASVSVDNGALLIMEEY